LQAQYEEFYKRLDEIRKERDGLLDIIEGKKIEVEKIEMEIGLLKAEVLAYEQTS
jgi:uncharacterized coiled-coil DUF342 family protein